MELFGNDMIRRRGGRVSKNDAQGILTKTIVTLEDPKSSILSYHL